MARLELLFELLVLDELLLTTLDELLLMMAVELLATGRVLEPSSPPPPPHAERIRLSEMSEYS